jgi:small subunit ribosomal protein S1
VTSLPKFGAFVQLTEGVEGLVHISEITSEKRLNHPQEALKVGQTVKAQVLMLDTEKRLIKLSMKQLVPTDLDEYLAEHNIGDVVTGRVLAIDDGGNGAARVEFGDGVYGACPPTPEAGTGTDQREGGGASGNVSDLGSMLMARWKGSAQAGPRKPEPMQSGQIRQFRITQLDRESKKIEVAMA